MSPICEWYAHQTENTSHLSARLLVPINASACKILCIFSGSSNMGLRMAWSRSKRYACEAKVILNKNGIVGFSPRPFLVPFLFILFAFSSHFQVHWLSVLPVLPGDCACAVPWRDAFVFSSLACWPFALLLMPCVCR